MKKYKRLISFIFVILLAADMTCSTLALSGEWGVIGDKTVKGDVNGDLKVDETDLELVKDHIVGTNVLTFSQLKRADTDKNNTVDIRDYNTIYSIIYGNQS